MSPLIDVVFQMLIFFLVASEVRPTEADFETNLPAGAGPLDRKMVKNETARIYIKNVDATGNVVRVSLNNVEMPAGAAAWQSVTANLMGVLNKVKASNLLVIIDGDANVKLQYVSDALDAVIGAGVTQVTFGRPKD
jgi:biopolymer transport protein ExbD